MVDDARGGATRWFGKSRFNRVQRGVSQSKCMGNPKTGGLDGLALHLQPGRGGLMQADGSASTWSVHLEAAATGPSTEDGCSSTPRPSIPRPVGDLARRWRVARRSTRPSLHDSTLCARRRWGMFCCCAAHVFPCGVSIITCSCTAVLTSAMQPGAPGRLAGVGVGPWGLGTAERAHWRGRAGPTTEHTGTTGAGCLSSARRACKESWPWCLALAHLSAGGAHSARRPTPLSLHRFDGGPRSACLVLGGRRGRRRSSRIQATQGMAGPCDPGRRKQSLHPRQGVLSGTLFCLAHLAKTIAICDGCAWPVLSSFFGLHGNTYPGHIPRTHTQDTGCGRQVYTYHNNRPRLSSWWWWGCLFHIDCPTSCPIPPAAIDKPCIRVAKEGARQLHIMRHCYLD